MVRALLAGTKTQTRRKIKPRGNRPSLFNGDWSDSYVLDPGNESWRKQDIRIETGDRLWVKETWRAHSWASNLVEIAYAAQRGLVGWTEQHEQILYPNGDKNAFKYYAPKGPEFWRPSIFMPRWASRLTLTVTEVRVQRLQDISETDAIAEGVEIDSADPRWFGYRDYGISKVLNPTARGSYRTLWDAINGPRAWEANSWVAAYTFTVHRQNIDVMSKEAA
jgi:hypothetical protein